MAKGIWSLLEKVGLAEEAPEPETPAAPPHAPKPSSAPPAVVRAPVNQEDQARFTEIDKSARDQLSQAMDSADAKLVEELGDTLETLKDAIPDEKARYTAAIKLMVKKGHAVSALLSDLDKCIGVLEEKDREFNAQLKGQFEKRVGAKQTAFATCNEQIKSKNEQIQLLEAEIAHLTVQRDDAQAGISGEQTKLTQVQERFEMAYRALRSEVESQRAKIAQYGSNL